MKNILIILFISFTATCYAQKIVKPNVEITANGNFKAIKTESQNFTKTSKTYTDSKGVEYPVFVTTKGKYFVLKISKKTGNEYRYYLNLPK